MSDTNAIDRAINEAKARKAMKEQAAANGDTTTISSGKSGVDFTKAKEVTPKAEKVKAEKAPKVAKEKDATKEAEKAAKKAAQDAERAERKAKRDAARAEKKAEREAKQSNKVAHMSKVDKAASKLAKLDESTLSVFKDLTTNLSRAQIGALAEHLNHFNRVQATQRALTAKLTVGDTVKITGGDPRYVGMVGTLDKVQRIRCFCVVEGVSKPIYCFTSDVEIVEAEETPAEETAEAVLTQGNPNVGRWRGLEPRHLSPSTKDKSHGLSSLVRTAVCLWWALRRNPHALHVVPVHCGSHGGSGLRGLALHCEVLVTREQKLA